MTVGAVRRNMDGEYGAKGGDGCCWSSCHND